MSDLEEVTVIFKVVINPYELIRNMRNTPSDGQRINTVRDYLSTLDWSEVEITKLALGVKYKNGL